MTTSFGLIQGHLQVCWLVPWIRPKLVVILSRQYPVQSKIRNFIYLYIHVHILYICTIYYIHVHIHVHIHIYIYIYIHIYTIYYIHIGIIDIIGSLDIIGIMRTLYTVHNNQYRYV